MTKVGSLRASDADREEIVSRLRHASTEGRIAADELEQRVSAALKARTYAELDALVADLPRQPLRRPGRDVHRRPAASWALSTVRSHPWLLLLAVPAVAVTATVLLTAMVMWAVVMVVVMVFGGRCCAPRGPWMYTRRRTVYAPPRGRARSYWA